MTLRSQDARIERLERDAEPDVVIVLSSDPNAEQRLAEARAERRKIVLVSTDAPPCPFDR